MSTNAVNDRAWVATRKGLFELSRRHFLRQWGEIQEFIEKETKRRETL